MQATGFFQRLQAVACCPYHLIPMQGEEVLESLTKESVIVN
jgi:hypothetical protein